LAPVDRAKRVLKPAKELETIAQKNPDSCEIFQAHWVLDVYPDRPDELESLSLYEFLGWYEKHRSTSKDQLQLKSLGYSLRRRNTTPYIVTHQTVNPNQSDENKERYFFHLLKLFKPWRTESDLCSPGKNYYETYLNECNILLDMKEYHEKQVQTSQQEEQMEKTVNERAERMKKTEQDVIEVEDQGCAFDSCRTDQLRTAMQDVVDTHIRSAQKDRTDSDSLAAAYSTLNCDQQRIVDKVVTAVCHSHEQLRLIVSGQGGTGKSKVIDVLNQTVMHHLNDTTLPVVIAAPTGLTSFNVGGMTIHRMLCLPVEHRKPADYCHLQQEQLTLLKATLKGMKLLIIDEVSMVSSLTLLFIHLRLTEVMCSNELFGGVSVVFFR